MPRRPRPAPSYEHIGVRAPYSEGYVLCYNGVNAWDTGTSSSGFGTPTTSSNAIVRRTSDNRVQLTQTFQLFTGSPTTFVVCKCP